ncbi:MAG TPA: ergot alkaloid biosynthesis protein [Acidimicrobiales bacterium]
MSGRILVTGGTGKTGRRVVEALREQGALGVPAARSVPPGGVRFDWADPASWSAALDGVRAAYLVAPAAIGNASETMISFVETAIERGVERFVLLSGSPIEAGGPMTGKVHAWLQTSDAEWAVLRPSWFMENLSEGPHHPPTIRHERAIYTAAGDGRVPFINTWDIARAAAHTLTSEQAPNTDFVLTGTELLSYSDVAQRLSSALGVTITHHPLTFEELVVRHMAHGLTETQAQTIAIIDLVIAEGAEERITGCVEHLTQQAPISFDQFVGDNIATWSRA